MKGETKETYVNSMKSSRTISRFRCLYETDVSRVISVLVIRDLISDYENRDDPRNVGSIQTSEAAGSPRRFHRI
jgi:hypothetical protein